MKNHWLSGGQIRAARALLRWSVEQLAREASLGRNTIKRAEAKDGKTSLTTANELAIRRAFEGAGVEFTNGDQPGVRLTKAAAARSRQSASASAAAEKGGRGKPAPAPEKKR
jgi:DNA-binding XRE family transcriptional regulator